MKLFLLSLVNIKDSKVSEASSVEHGTMPSEDILVDLANPPSHSHDGVHPTASRGRGE